MVKSFILILFLASTCILFPPASSADPLDNWQPRSFDSIRDVTYGKGIFVAVGADGTIMTSRDGSAWTLQISGTTKSFSRVTFGNGVFVAVGTDAILTSPDGAVWTQTFSDYLNSVTFGNGFFVAVGYDGAILTSPDGFEWTSQASGTTDILEDVIYGNGIFVAVGGWYDMFGLYSRGIILTSEDGLSWTPRISGDEVPALSSVAHGNGTFVIVGGRVLISADGISWSQIQSADNYDIRYITYGGDIFVGASRYGRILTSTDGIVWTETFSDNTYGFHSVFYGNGTVFVVGDRYSNLGVILSSLDAFDWTITSGTTNELWGVTYGSNNFVAVGRGNAILTSPNGVRWTKRFSEIEGYLHGVTFGNGFFVAAGGYFDEATTSRRSTIITSQDGIDWSKTLSEVDDYLNGVTYGNGTFVAVGSNYTDSNFDKFNFPYRTITLTSANGFNWYLRHSGSMNGQFLGVGYGDGTFVAVGSRGIFLTSLDGIYWKGDISDPYVNKCFIDCTAHSVTYGNGMFISVGDLGKIFWSLDGTTWISAWDAGVRLYDVTYGNGALVAVGNHGTILTSRDGLHWNQITVKPAKTLRGVTYGNGAFIAVGDDGAIFQSDFLSGNCTARLLLDLSLHVPVVIYDGSYFQADAECQSSNGDILCRLTNYSSVNPDDFSDCDHSTLSPDMKLHIPAGVYDNISYNAAFEHIPTSDGQMWFRMTGAERN
jgi:hypothetical protein